MLIPVTPAAAEPVSLAEAKAHLRVIHDVDDALITRLITAAREVVESNTGWALAEAGYRWVTDLAPPVGLPLWPVEVTGVSYLDSADTRTVTTEYVFDADRGVLSFTGTGWRALNVEFTTDPAPIPAALKAAILLIVGELYEHTEASAEKAVAEVPAVQRLIFPHRRNLGV
jgi:uncharacterized phiE125 gp8 family phage protein